jgi:outer membrane protein, multidrug efflux system
MTRVAKLTPLLAVAMLSAGCMLMPRYQRPAAPVPAAFLSGTPVSAPQLVAAELPSHDFFEDAQLNRLVSLALDNNRDLRIAVLNVEQSQAQYRITRSAVFPTLQGSGGFSRQRTVVGVLPGFSAGSTAITSNDWSASVGVTAYELDLFGRVRSLNLQALEQYFATEEAQRGARVSLVAQVATEYFVMRQAQEQLRLAHDTLAAVQDSYQLNLATFNAGASNELDLRQAQSQVQTAQLSIETYERQVIEAQNALQLLLGTPLPADLPAPLAFSATDMMAVIGPGLPSDLVARRPDILEAEHNLEAANANIGAARAAFFPTISLTGSGGVTSPQLSSLFNSGSGVWSFAPQISVPIFSGGEHRAQLKSALVAERIQVATYQKAIQTAFREVADALVDIDAYSRQIQTDRALVSTEQRRLDLAMLRYRHGQDAYLSVLTAQQDLYGAQQGLLQAELSELSSQVALYQALGGGWK